jgi:predicted glutamine amidotransferase
MVCRSPTQSCEESSPEPAQERLTPMCRLLGWTTREPATLAEVIGEAALRRFTALAGVHSHGWGAAWRQSGQGIRHLKETCAADQSPAFLEIATRLRATAAIVHLRRASSGLAVSRANTHPFVADGVAFAHNGYIPDSACLLDLLTDFEAAHLNGETDSERYFAVMRNHAHGRFHPARIRTGIAEVIRTTNPFSLNSLLLTEDSLFGIALHHRPGDRDGEAVEGYKTPDYYDMSYTYTRERFVVASGGWQDERWSHLPNRTGLSLSPDRPDDFFTFHLIDKTNPRRFNSATH